jgi:integrase
VDQGPESQACNGRGLCPAYSLQPLIIGRLLWSEANVSSGPALKLRVRDVAHGDRPAARANVIQQKTERPVQFELTEATRAAVSGWIHSAHLRPEDFLFPSRVHASPHLGTRQYARIVDGWMEEIGLDSADYGTHSMRRTKASLVYSRTRNPRAV